MYSLKFLASVLKPKPMKFQDSKLVNICRKHFEDNLKQEKQNCTLCRYTFKLSIQETCLTKDINSSVKCCHLGTYTTIIT